MSTFHKAISIRQPWANLIMEGKKTLEIRTWKTSYRGDLVICSSKVPEIPPNGCALGIVDLVDIRPMEEKDAEASCHPYVPNCYVWELKVKEIFTDPQFVKGRLSIFEIEL